MLLRRARGLGASAEEAEDLAQATLLRYVRDPSLHDPSKGALPAWLCTVLKRRFLDARRRGTTRTKAVPVLRLVQPESASPDAELERRRAAERRQRFLDALTAQERHVFEAWLAQRRGDLDVHSASASVDLTPASYEAAKKRLRRRCAALLNELGMTPADLVTPGEGSAA